MRAKPELEFSPKSHAERIVPVSPALAEVLRMHRRRLIHGGEEDFVFQRNKRRGARWADSSALCATVRRVFEDAKLYDKRRRTGLHMLRRSGASLMLGSGIDIATVMEVCGWGSLTVVERYAKASAASKRRAVEVAGEGLV